MGRITAGRGQVGGQGRGPVAEKSKWRTRGHISYGMAAAILVIYPLASLLFKLRYRHGERLPTTGPVLVVANHVSILDPLACARLVFDNGPVPTRKPTGGSRWASRDLSRLLPSHSRRAPMKRKMK